MTAEAVEFRLTVEALRAGVATKAAAKHVGTTQRAAMNAFHERLANSEAGDAVEPLAIGGPFGSGKSHFLQCLRSEALGAGYAVSLVSVGPEAPLGRLDLLLRTLANATEASDVVGKATRELAISPRVDGMEFREFAEWVRASDLDPRFGALVDLYAGFYADDEFRLRIVDDFEGRTLPRAEMRARLKQLGIASTDALAARSQAELAPQRLRLLPQFLRACGRRGWVLLFDEVEVLGRFGPKQRLAAYASLGRIAEAARTGGSRLIPVFASTGGSYLEFISEDEAHLAVYDNDSTRDARRGIDLFRRVLPLTKPDRIEANEIMYRVKAIYDEAYGVRSPDPRIDNELLGYQLRTQIRTWVTQWDLHRHYPQDRLEVSSGEVFLDAELIGEELQVTESDLDG
jgi:hypothetical protein